MLQGYGGIDPTTLQEAAGDSYWGQADMLLEDMLNKTGASRNLSPYYTNLLRNRANRYAGENVLGTLSSGSTDVLGGLTDFLKNSLAGRQSPGWGDLKHQFNSVLNMANASREHVQGGAPVEGSLYGFMDVGGGMGLLNTALQRILAANPATSWYASSIPNTFSQAQLQRTQNPDFNWFDYLRQTLGGIIR
jgi:hypothetical protein